MYIYGFNQTVENGVGVNDRSLSRKHIIEGMRGSLNRLQLTYVDIVFAHRYDEGVPIEEVVRAFDWLIRKGKAFYWGTSMWTPAQIMEANECCEKLGLMKPVVEQSEYSMLKRDNMENMLPFIFEMPSGLLFGRLCAGAAYREI